MPKMHHFSNKLSKIAKRWGLSALSAFFYFGFFYFGIFFFILGPPIKISGYASDL